MAVRMMGSVCVLALATAGACGGAPKRPANDEVSAPMEAEDLRALEPGADAGTDSGSRSDFRLEPDDSEEGVSEGVVDGGRDDE